MLVAPVHPLPTDKDLLQEIQTRLGYLTADLDLDRWFFDIDEADRWMEFLRRYITFTSAEWDGMQFEPLEWQEFLWIRPLVGWRERATGLRMIRESAIFVPKKNGKTETMAGLNLGGLCIDGENTPEIYQISGSQEQAETLFTACARMVQRSTKLQSLVELFEGSDVIRHRTNGGKLQALTSEAERKDGFKTHWVTADEYHVFKNRKLMDMMWNGAALRRQPLKNIISTFGEDFDERPIGKLYERCKYVVEGKVKNHRLHTLIFEAPEKERDNWQEPRVWAMANPTYPTSPKHDFLEGMAKDAEFDIVVRRDLFLKYLNLRHQGENSFLQKLEHWDNTECKFELKDMLRVPCVAGMDLADSDDLNAVCLKWYKDGLYWSMHFYWMPEDSLKKREPDVIEMYYDWTERKYIMKTPGEIMDYSFIEQWYLELRKFGINIEEIRYDPNKATLLNAALEKHGFKMQAITQGHRKMGPPTRMLRDVIRKEQYRHNGNPVSAWQVRKALIHIDEHGNFILDKKRTREKIDGLVADAITMSKFMNGGEPVVDYNAHFTQNKLSFF